MTAAGRITSLGLVLAFAGCASLGVRPIAGKTRPRNNPRCLITLRTADAVRAKRLVPLREDFRAVGAAPGSPESVRVVTRRAQAARIRDAGVPIEAQTEAIPRALLDPLFAAQRRNPVGLDERGEPVVGHSYKDAAMVEALLEAVARRHPDIARLDEIGRTRRGRPILALLITARGATEEDRPAFLFDGAHHGSELLSIEPVLDIISHLTSHHASDERVRRWVGENRIWCVPVVNPDGLDSHWHLAESTGRNNVRDVDGDGKVALSEGVDLNRNYPFFWGRGGKRASSDRPGNEHYRGPFPGSEPETQALMRLAAREHFVASISFHTAATSVLVPYTIDGAAGPFPSTPWIVARELHLELESHRPGRPYRLQRQLYPVDGTDQDWHLAANGTLAYLVELPRHNPDYAERDPICAGVRPLWMGLLDRLARGPSISGRVTDAESGEPLEALVAIDEIVWAHGERHTSHPVTGRFDRILPLARTYHLRVSKPGYVQRVLEVEVGEERVWVQVPLERQANAISVVTPERALRPLAKSALR